MPRPSKTRRLDVWMNGERVGRWAVSSQNQHSLQYDQGWLASSAARPLSLSLPLQPAEVPHVGPVVESYFDNLLPESAEIRRRAQHRFGAASSSAFDLLAQLGRDCIGAVQLSMPERTPGDVRGIDAEPLTSAEVADLLRRVVLPTTPGQDADEAFRISIAGAQEKTALLWHQGSWHRPLGTTPSTHLFKLPLGHVGADRLDLSDSVENEWLCARIVQAYGLAAAHCDIARFEDQRALIVERFDRRLAPGGSYWLRLPQEDMCQALGFPPALKYEAHGGPGLRDILNVLLGADDARSDRRTFFKAQLVFWLLAAIDGHAKNFSVFIRAGGGYSLTPLYDVLSAHPLMGRGRNRIAPEKLKMAMAVWGANRHYSWRGILPRHWRKSAADCGLGAEVDVLIDEVIRETPQVVATVMAELPPEFPPQVAEPIFDGITKASARLART